MGGDMVIELVFFPENVVLADEKMKLIALANTKPLDKDEVDVIFNEYSLGDGEAPLNEDATLDEASVRKVFNEILDEFFKCLGYRDVTYFNHKGDRIYVTGGMNYGDAATDSSNVFYRFNVVSDYLNGELHFVTEIDET